MASRRFASTPRSPPRWPLLILLAGLIAAHAQDAPDTPASSSAEGSFHLWPPGTRELVNGTLMVPPQPVELCVHGRILVTVQLCSGTAYVVSLFNPRRLSGEFDAVEACFYAKRGWGAFPPQHTLIIRPVRDEGIPLWEWNQLTPQQQSHLLREDLYPPAPPAAPASRTSSGVPPSTVPAYYYARQDYGYAPPSYPYARYGWNAPGGGYPPRSYAQPSMPYYPYY